jgi:hypothetical protein
MNGFSAEGIVNLAFTALSLARNDSITLPLGNRLKSSIVAPITIGIAMTYAPTPVAKNRIKEK